MVPTPDKDRASLQPLPLVAGFIFSARACITLLWFQDEPQQGTIVSIALSFALCLAAVYSLFGKRSTFPPAAFRTMTLRWIASLLALNFLSLAWTAAPITAAASYWAGWAVDCLTAWLIMRFGDSEIRADAMLKGYVSGACVVAIIAWCLPVMYDLRLGDETFLHPNAIGISSAIGSLIALYLGHQNKIWRLPAFWLTLTLIRTISKTSIIAFLFAMAFYLFKDAILTRSAKIKIAIAGIIIIASLSVPLATYFDAYTESTDPATLTGRTVIWASASEVAMETPILGHGFYSFRYLVPNVGGTFEALHAHDEFLQQFFVTGIVGALVLLALYWSMIRQIIRAPRSSLKSLCATLLIFALLHGITDTQTFDLSFPLWLMTILSILLASSPSLSAPPSPQALDSENHAVIA